MCIFFRISNYLSKYLVYDFEIVIFVYIILLLLLYCIKEIISKSVLFVWSWYRFLSLKY